MGIDVNSGLTLPMIMGGMDRAHKNAEVILLYAHKPSNSPTSYEVAISRIDTILTQANNLGFRFYRFVDLE